MIGIGVYVICIRIFCVYVTWLFYLSLLTCIIDVQACTKYGNIKNKMATITNHKYICHQQHRQQTITKHKQTSSFTTHQQPSHFLSTSNNNIPLHHILKNFFCCAIWFNCLCIVLTGNQLENLLLLTAEVIYDYR